jgi:hypothetical protein
MVLVLDSRLVDLGRVGRDGCIDPGARLGLEPAERRAKEEDGGGKTTTMTRSNLR